MVFDPQSWFADPELELGSELPASFLRGYRSLVPAPPDLARREPVYDLMVALIYCTCMEGEELEKHVTRSLQLAKEISNM